MTRPLCLDLFSGAGGTALGLHRAGFDVTHFEWDHHACETLRAAFPGDDVHEGDLRQAPWASWRGKVHLLWSSFPCQAWSTAGKRAGALDERNGWPWTVDAVDACDPTWLLCENVEGLTMHRGGAAACPRDATVCPGCYFDGVILPQLRERFAHVSWRVLDAADYGVPQRRHRVIIAAGPVPFPWPEPTHCDPAFRIPINLGRRKPWASVRQALDLDGGTRTEPEHALVVRNSGHSPATVAPIDRPSPTVIAPPKGTYDRLKIATGSAEFLSQLSEDPKHAGVGVDHPASTIRGGGDGHGAPHYWIRQEMTGNPSVPVDASAPTVSGGGILYLHAGVDPGTRPQTAAKLRRARDRDVAQSYPAPTSRGGTVFELFGDEPSDPSPDTSSLPKGGQVLDADRPASTLRAQGSVDASGHLGGCSPPSVVTDTVRRVTVSECAVLQGFPVDHPFQGNKTQQYRQVGNAVPPPVAEALGRAILSVESP